MDNRLPKKERLKSRKQITTLFARGKSFKRFPLRMVYDSAAVPCHKMGVSVPKRLFKRAVDRNRLKRLIRESYRLNKPLLKEESRHYAFMFIYLDRNISDFNRIDKAVRELLSELKKNEHP